MLAGAVLFGTLQGTPEGEPVEPVERADGAGEDAVPPRLVGHGAEADATSSTAHEPEAPRADGPPRLERPVLRWLEDALPEGVVAGRIVTAAGEPLAEARVELVDLLSGARRHAPPDADGRFRVEDVEGAYRIVVSADGWATSQWVALPGLQSVEILLVPESSIDGIVVDARSGGA